MQSSNAGEKNNHDECQSRLIIYMAVSVTDVSTVHQSPMPPTPVINYVRCDYNTTDMQFFWLNKINIVHDYDWEVSGDSGVG